MAGAAEGTVLPAQLCKALVAQQVGNKRQVFLGNCPLQWHDWLTYSVFTATVHQQPLFLLFFAPRPHQAGALCCTTAKPISLLQQNCFPAQ